MLIRTHFYSENRCSTLW